jgi:hypothetical protein
VNGDNGGRVDIVFLWLAASNITAFFAIDSLWVFPV